MSECILHVLSDILFLLFERPATNANVLCSDLNRLVLDYLVIEGYKSAAEEFCQEANLTPPVDFESIETRMDIREALQRGDVEDAITRVNDLNPEVSRVPARIAIGL
jgi:molybdopterin-guanine dinucleotide biosynthesis protein